jgi:hypothetical protein
MTITTAARTKGRNGSSETSNGTPSDTQNAISSRTVILQTAASAFGLSLLPRLAIAEVAESLVKRVEAQPRGQMKSWND